MDALIEIFSFKGRANRLWYFWHVLLDDMVIGTMLIALIVVAVVTGTMLHWSIATLFALPILGVMIGGIWAVIAITVKRLHDIERPGWHFLLFAIPLYNIYLGLVLLFKKGTIGPNRYGADPLAAQYSAGYLEE